MGAGRGVRRQHLLGHDIALELRALVTAVFFRPGHADPTLGPDLAGEFARKPALAAMPREGAGLGLLAQKRADFLAQFPGLGRQLDRVEAKAGGHRVLAIPGGYESWVIRGHSWSAPAAATMRPRRWAQTASLPNSSRHAHSRRVA